MVWTFHHILLDGRAFPLILREVFGFGGPHHDGTKPESSAPPEFRKHVEWLHDQDDAASQAYWKECLAGFRTPCEALG